MSEWKVVGPDQKYIALVTLHTIWGLWADEDAIELHAAIDEFTHENNWEHYQTLLAEARKKFGAANVREAEVKIPWPAITEAFEPAQTEGVVSVRSHREQLDGEAER